MKEQKGWVKKELEEIMAENFLNLARDINSQIQESKKTSNKINFKKYSS